MYQTSFVATASPHDGSYHIEPAFEQLAEADHIEAFENSHRQNLISAVTEQMTNAIALANPTRGSRQSSPMITPVKKRKSARRRISP